jgi:curved DNA-binding protein CbpA
MTLTRRYMYYQILGLTKDASEEDIEQAYLTLMAIYHSESRLKAPAQAEFQRIIEAYEVLSDPTNRADYDDSSAECPVCWTHKVQQLAETQLRCLRDGYEFTASGTVTKKEPKAKPGAKSSSAPLTVVLFNSTQCSWCKKFYTEKPCLCPFNRLESSCLYFDELGVVERDILLHDKKWWSPMENMLRQVQNKGKMSRCRKCWALNPNPRVDVCWQCHESLCCPKHRHLKLDYNIETMSWSCPDPCCTVFPSYRSQ